MSEHGLTNTMNMLPNDHHPGPRCSCAECQRRYPEDAPLSVADALAYLRTDEADLHDRMCADVIERLTAALKRYDADPDACTADGIPCVSHMALLGLQDELQAVRAQPAPQPLSIAAIRSVIAEMIAIAADGDRDADWTADNCAQIDKWQVRLADALTKSGDAPYSRAAFERDQGFVERDGDGNES